MSTPLHIWSVDRLLVCVPADLPEAIADRLRGVLVAAPAGADAGAGPGPAATPGHPSVDVVLEVLSGGGLAATPSFLCAQAETDGVRVVVRGDLQAIAHGTDGSSLPLDAGRAATWHDDVVSDITSITLTTRDGGTFTWLSTRDGVSPAGTPASPSGLAPPSPLPHAPAPPPQPANSTPPTSAPAPSPPTSSTASKAPAPSPRASAGYVQGTPPVPEEAGEPHTLDADDFQRLTASDAALDPSSNHPAPPEPPEPTTQPSAHPAPRPGLPPELDFSGLLESTRHGDPAPTSVPTGPAVTPSASHHPPAPAHTSTAPTSSRPPAPPPTSPEPPDLSAEAPADPSLRTPPPEPTITGMGEHDGRTVTLADLRRLRDEDDLSADPTISRLPPPPPQPPTPRPPAGSATSPAPSPSAPPPPPNSLSSPGAPPSPAPPPASSLSSPAEPPPPDPPSSHGAPAPPSSPPPPPTAPPPPIGPPRAGEVRAVRCPAGHANPPTADTCRLCHSPVTDRSVLNVPRPVLARLVFESGLIVDVDRPQVIGRKPTAPSDAVELPNLITVPSPDSDISRCHTAVRLEGWDLLVEDIGSTNGTEVKLPQGVLHRIREHDPVLVVVGTEVTMAGVVRFRVEAPEA